MSRGAAGNVSPASAKDSVPPGLAVRPSEEWSAVSQLLSPRVLERLCGKDSPSQARRAQLSQSQVIVATYHDKAIGFLAYKSGAGGVQVAQELWVDTQAPCGVATVASALIERLEQEALWSGCDKLFIVVPQNTPLRRILQSKGYAIVLEGADLLYFEKTFRGGTGAVR